MKTIKLGTKNDIYTYAVQIGNTYVAMTDQDAKFERPDAIIYFDSGYYPSISNIEQYRCDEASRSIAANH